MMEPIDIAKEAVEKLRADIRKIMVDRNKNATNSTTNGIAVIPSQGQGFGQALLEADSTWKWVGNGRGPGKMPPVAPIQAWINARGLTLNAWGVARKIGLKGSKDFREKRRNVFLQGIETWEKEALPIAEGKMAANMETKVYQVIDQALK
jgi:hypothetical protein